MTLTALLREAVTGYVDQHYPKNETAAQGGPRTPRRGEAIAELGRFIAELEAHLPVGTHLLALDETELQMVAEGLRRIHPYADLGQELAQVEHALERRVEGMIGALWSAARPADEHTSPHLRGHRSSLPGDYMGNDDGPWAVSDGSWKGSTTP